MKHPIHTPAKPAERDSASPARSEPTWRERRRTVAPDLGQESAPNRASFSLANIPILPARSLAASSLQAKLRVGGTETPAERQADELARSLERGGREPAGGLMRPSLPPLAQGGGAPVPRSFLNGLERTNGNGAPLPASVQQELGPKLGADLRNVRVHTGAASAGLNEAIGARAFTVGSDIHFNAGEYSPSSAPGRELLAHELTHTMQQSAAAAPLIQRTPQRALRVARRALGLPPPRHGDRRWPHFLWKHREQLIERDLLNDLQDVAEESEEEDQLWLANRYPALALFDDPMDPADALQLPVRRQDQEVHEANLADDDQQLESLWDQEEQDEFTDSAQRRLANLGGPQQDWNEVDMRAQLHRMRVDAGLEQESDPDAQLARLEDPGLEVPDPELKDLEQRSDELENYVLRQHYNQLLRDLGLDPETLDMERRLQALQDFNLQRQLRRQRIDAGLELPSDEELQERFHALQRASGVDPEMNEMESRLAALEQFLLEQQLENLPSDEDLVEPSDDDLQERFRRLQLESGVDPEMNDFEARLAALKAPAAKAQVPSSVPPLVPSNQDALAQSPSDMDGLIKLQQQLAPHHQEPMTQEESDAELEARLAKLTDSGPLPSQKVKAKSKAKASNGGGGSLMVMKNQKSKVKQKEEVAPEVSELDELEQFAQSVNQMGHQQKFRPVMRELLANAPARQYRGRHHAVMRELLATHPIRQRGAVMQQLRNQHEDKQRHRVHQRVMQQVRGREYEDFGFRRLADRIQPQLDADQLDRRLGLREHRFKLQNVHDEMHERRWKEDPRQVVKRLQPEQGLELEQLRDRTRLKQHLAKFRPVMEELTFKKAPIGAVLTGDSLHKAKYQTLLGLMSQDASFGQALDDFNPDMGLRLKRAMMKPETYLNMLPVYRIPKTLMQIRHTHRKAKAMESLQKGQGQSQALDSTLTTHKVHNKVKRNVAIAQAVLDSASLATGAAGTTVSSALSPALSSLGTAAATAISSTTSSVTTATVKGSTYATTDYLTRRGDKKKQNQFGKSVLKVKGSQRKKRGALISEYKNNRAFLYHLGHAAVQDSSALKQQGSNRDSEEARLAMKKRFGASANMDLTQRTQRNLGWGRKDWLTERERGFYTQLKKGEITYDDVPQDVLLPILWQTNKLFDYHVQLMKEKAEAQAAKAKAKQQKVKQQKVNPKQQKQKKGWFTK